MLISAWQSASPARKQMVLAATLCALTLVAYWPVTQCGFVNFDDDQYVTENPNIQLGLTIQSIKWALGSGYGGNWHPLTWISHMLDVQIFALQPLGHHLTNLFLHLSNSILLFLLVTRMTVALWRSFLVASLFAIHPLHVESVAWVSERKDVLSTFFALLSLLAYTAYVTRSRSSGGAAAPATSAPESASVFPSASVLRLQHPPRDRFPGLDYCLALVFFSLALMSKPMVVTIPFIMLLLDYWPLGRNAERGEGTRFRWEGWKPLILEKVPFFLLSAVCCLVTFLVQDAEGATQLNTSITLPGRLGNAVVSYVRYLGLTFWPTDLTVFYEHPLRWPALTVAGATLLLASITAAIVWVARSKPYLVTGWFWFIGTLVPVIGLIQVGNQAMADRYMYVPSIGLFLALAWGLGELGRRGRLARVLVVAGVLGSLLPLLAATRIQAQYWRSSETLFRHALAINDNSALAHNNLGTALSLAEKYDEAEQHYLAALRIRPDYPDAEINYAIALSREGRFEEAMARFAGFLVQHPADANTHFNLGSVLAQRGDITGAIEHYNEALRLRPAYPDALNNLAWIRAAHARPDLRNGEEAVRLARKACELTNYRKPVMIGTLAAAYAETGQFDLAVMTAEKARDLARSSRLFVVAEKNQELLELYRRHKAFHERE